MNFAKDFAGKQLRNHMFKDEISTNKNKWDQLIDGIVESLRSSSRHLTHGRMITAQDMKSDPQLKELKVTDLPASDTYWLAASELLLRTEIIAQQNEFGKVLFAKNFQMFGN